MQRKKAIHKLGRRKPPILYVPLFLLLFLLLTYRLSATLTHATYVSRWLFSRFSRVFRILASMSDFGPSIPESSYSTTLIAGLQSESNASMFVLWCPSNARAIPSSSPSMCVALIPRYLLPVRSGWSLVLCTKPARCFVVQSRSVRKGCGPAPFIFFKVSDPYLPVPYNPGVSFVPNSLDYRSRTCFFLREKCHWITLSPFSPMVASISSRHVLYCRCLGTRAHAVECMIPCSAPRSATGTLVIQFYQHQY